MRGHQHEHPRERYPPRRPREPSRSRVPSPRCPPDRDRPCRTRCATARTPRRAAGARAGSAPSRPRGSAATCPRAAARVPPRPSAPRGPSRCRQPRTPGASRPSRPGAWPSTCRAPSSASFASSSGEPATTPGKFIISASPSTRRRRMSDSRSPGVSASARRLERRCRNARGRHEVDVELELRARVEQPVHAVDAEDVRDLVWVGDDRRRPERQHEARELVDHELHRLEVHVRVDESGYDVAPGRVERLAALVRSQPGDRRRRRSRRPRRATRA